MGLDISELFLFTIGAKAFVVLRSLELRCKSYKRRVGSRCRAGLRRTEWGRYGRRKSRARYKWGRQYDIGSRRVRGRSSVFFSTVRRRRAYSVYGSRLTACRSPMVEAAAIVKVLGDFKVTVDRVEDVEVTGSALSGDYVYVH